MTQSQQNVIGAVNTLKTLGSQTRFKIIILLLQEHTNLCVKEIADAIGMSHSATSHQLTKLEDRNILTSFRKGQTICYRLNDNRETLRLRRIIQQIT